MINPRELARPPIREQPILTIGQVKFPIRAFVVDTRSETYLFAMRGHEQFSLLKNIWGDVVGRAEVSRSQELAFEVMGEFGFDPNALMDERRSINNAIIHKTATYPSKTIGGLVFERVTESTVGEETPFRVEWRVRDAARRFRIGSKDKVKKAA